MGKNVVMSIASGYKYYLIEPFFRSLRDTGYKDDIVIFYTYFDNKTIKKLKERGVTLIHFDQKKYDQKKIHIMHYRFQLYYDFLKNKNKEYKNVLLADVRDIYFQKNPFEYNKYASLNLFCENQKIKDCKINSYVFEASSSKRDLDKYKDNYVICAGTTIGSYKGVMDYLKKMNKKLMVTSKLFDQGYHNYLFYSGKLKDSKRFINFEGPILTYSGLKQKDLLFNSKNNLINKDRSVINILHQYDRNWYLMYKANTFYYFILNLLRTLKIKLKRGIKITLFNLPFVGKYFRKKYHDPTRFT